MPPAPRLSWDCALSSVVALGWFKCCEDLIIILLVYVCSLQFSVPFTCVQQTLLLLKQVTRIHTGEGL